MTKHDPISWLTSSFPIEQSNAAEFIYAGMASQSNYNWPILDLPFEPNNPLHIKFRSSILDFASSVGSGRILDFGTGDGASALLLAQMVDFLVGVDGSEMQIRNCRRNAAKLNVTNAEFVHVPPGSPLPFPDGSFDGATAAKSLEFVPDLQATLREMARVLRPGGCLRIVNDPLTIYAGAQENDLWITEDEGGNSTRMTIFQRDIEGERVTHYGMLLNCSFAHVKSIFQKHAVQLNYDGLLDPVLDDVRPFIVKAVHWKTTHPSVQNWRTMLNNAGFSKMEVTYSGDWVAVNVFDKMSTHDFKDMESVDKYLRPIIDVVSRLKSAPEDAFHVGPAYYSARLGPAFQMTRITAIR